MPAAAVASVAVPVPLTTPVPNQRRHCHDPLVPAAAPRFACRCRVQRRIRHSDGARHQRAGSLLGLPEALLRETGLFLIAYTALVGWLGARTSLPKGPVILVVAGNAAWTLASIALLLSGAVSPNLFGTIVILAQAIATGVFAELQYVGLRRSEGAVTV